MRYIIIGAGAVGGAIGGRLHESGGDVVLVARGAHFEAIRDRGLTLRTPDGTSVLPVPVVDRPEAVELRGDDVLVLAVKTQDTVAALDAWAPLAGGLPVLCAQNGVANERLALRRFRDVFGVCVWLPSSYLEPGVVTAPCAPLTGMLHIGRYPSPGTGGPDGTAAAIAAGLEKSPFLAAPVVPDVMRWKYTKLLTNLGNVVRALCGPAADDDGRELRARVTAEGEAVLRAAGIPYADEEERARVRGDRVEVRGDAADDHHGSTWQSLARGGSLETDYLNGEIVLLGRLHGVPTPVNETLQRLARTAVREGWSPGRMTAAGVAAAVAAGK